MTVRLGKGGRPLFGVSGGGEPEELLRRADHAMYDAKRSTPVERGIRVVSG